MRPESLPSKSSVDEGDDVVVVFPSDRQVTGRVEELVRCNGDVVHVVVWVEDYSDSRMYPPGWVYPWEDAPEAAL